MVENKYENYKQIFLENNGILRASKAIKLGIPKHIIYLMLQDGELVKETRGLYRLTDIPPLGNPDLMQVSYLIPKAVICLVSALYFYNLTTQIPYQVSIALDRHMKKPRIQFPPLKVYYFSRNIFSVGIQEHVIDGVKVKIYNREKTIADCFKYRNSIGKDVAIEALKDYLRSPNSNANQVFEYARINKAEKIIRPYLESLS
jgi:predicted transcriptional regulator of viral defense system